MATVWSGFRQKLVRKFGNDDQYLREIFAIVETRGCWHALKNMLQGRTLDQWARTHADASADEGMLWQSASHSRLDRRTPLMSALLATPRDAMLARRRHLAGGTDDLQTLAEDEPATLAGMTACASTGLDPVVADVEWGRAARKALLNWRRSSAGTLLQAGGLGLTRHSDEQQRTALHYAADLEDGVVVEMLLGSGADARTTDTFGRLPAHLAAIRGNQSLANHLLDVAGAGASEMRDQFGNTVSELMKSSSNKRQNDIDRHKGLSWLSFFRDFVSAGRPVLIEGGADDIPARSRWTDPKILEGILGADTTLACGLIPYAPDGTQTNLSKFVSSESSGSARRGKPRPYVFDVSLGRRKPEVLGDVEIMAKNVLDEYVAYVRQPQFGIGFESAGAPMHTHHAALNALFVGSKRWVLAPPELSFWTFVPSAEWAESGQLEQLRLQPGVLEFVQKPGDLVFVPKGWGHATFVEEYSVGIGQEFIPNTCMSS